jgi:pyruvate/2-oxoglutarate dehydrogenase complex dihydrolipoamide acyltransferase (E2) component
MTVTPTRDHSRQVIPIPKLRRVLAAMYPAVQRAHKVRALIEVDVTDTRRMMRDQSATTGEPLSFTAFLVGCVAHAVAEQPIFNACRKGAAHLALYDAVDVAVPIEREVGGQKQPIVHIFRAANRLGVGTMTREMRAAQAAAIAAAWEGYRSERWLRYVPMVLIRSLWALFWWLRGRFPAVQRRYGGTVGLTAVGMFGTGGGWALPFDYHTLDVAVGGIASKPGLVGERIAIREYLCLTLSFDHDVIDGAPAARFLSRLRNLIESGDGLAAPSAKRTGTIR